MRPPRPEPPLPKLRFTLLPRSKLCRLLLPTPPWLKRLLTRRPATAHPRRPRRFRGRPHVRSVMPPKKTIGNAATPHTTRGKSATVVRTTRSTTSTTAVTTIAATWKKDWQPGSHRRTNNSTGYRPRIRNHDRHGNNDGIASTASDGQSVAAAVVTTCGGSNQPGCTTPSPLLQKGHEVAWWFVFKFNSKVFPGCGGDAKTSCPFGGDPQSYKNSSQQFVYASSDSPTLQQGSGCAGDATGDSSSARRLTRFTTVPITT